MSDGQILYAEQDDVFVIKLCGELRFNLGSAIEQCIEKIETGVDAREVLVDMSEAGVVDSTVLGILAQLAMAVKAKTDDKPAILVEDPDIKRILQAVGFDRIFMIIDGAGQVYGSLSSVEPIDDEDQQVIAHRVLQAHKTLVDVDAKNHETFKEVIQGLEGTEKPSSSGA